MLSPLPDIAPVSAEARLAYVLQHFQLAYPDAVLPPIQYSAASPPDALITIGSSSGADDFFTKQEPYPPTVNWQAWQGCEIPFLFDARKADSLLKLNSDKTKRVAVITPDIISAAFYLLSGWQEYFSDERDQHGRFPYTASIQHRHGFVAVPVVNYYFDILKTAVEHVTGQPLHPRRWAKNAPFATFITHDVDELRSGWKAPAKAALKRGAWWQFGQLLWRHFTWPDAWDNLELVRQIVAGMGAKSTFFLLPEHRKAANGTPNADYRLSSIRDKVQAAVGDAEVGLHASIGCSTNKQLLMAEDGLLQSCLRNDQYGIRFHYLSWEPRLSIEVVEQSEVAYDSTLGFAEHYGFRNSYCLPFYPFDFTRGRACNFLEIPLNVMDVTLHHPNYLQLAPPEILPALLPMFQEIERFGGVCTLLWHNDHFDPANETTGPRQFAELMQYLRSRNSAFVNGQDILKELGVSS